MSKFIRVTEVLLGEKLTVLVNVNHIVCIEGPEATNESVNAVIQTVNGFYDVVETVEQVMMLIEGTGTSTRIPTNMYGR